MQSVDRVRPVDLQMDHMYVSNKNMVTVAAADRPDRFQ